MKSLFQVHFPEQLSWFLSRLRNRIFKCLILHMWNFERRSQRKLQHVFCMEVFLEYQNIHSVCLLVPSKERYKLIDQRHHKITKMVRNTFLEWSCYGGTITQLHNRTSKQDDHIQNMDHIGWQRVQLSFPTHCFLSTQATPKAIPYNLSQNSIPFAVVAVVQLQWA